MADFPFHVADAVVRPLHDSIMAALERTKSAEASWDVSGGGFAGSRRRKLWNVAHKYHCSIVGVCFACDELRGLMQRTMHLPRDASDFALHTTAVGACKERTQLAELLHKTLEKKYRLAIKRFSVHKTPSGLNAAWRDACKEATGIPGALWAVWTHPACDGKLEQDVYADIHMIQHQLGAGMRTDLKTLKRLSVEKGDLHRQLEALRVEMEALRQEKAAGALEFKLKINELRSEAAAKEAWGLGMYNELLSVKSAMPDLAERLVLIQQREEVWLQNTQLKSALSERDKELARLREFAKYAEEIFESLAREDETLAEIAAGGLSGKCVLCVGGRSGAVHSYREVVEQSGGRFLHHDGGLEESLHRINGVIAAADVVICQAGCVSHNAYWRVKDLCKRTGKPCMFVKGSGVSSFGKVVKEAGIRNEAGNEQGTAPR